MSDALAPPDMNEAKTAPAPTGGWVARLTPEVKLTFLLFLFSFFIAGVPRVFTQNASYSLFIAAYGAGAVPYAYIAQAICVPIAGWIYLQGEHRLNLRTLILTTLATNATVLVLFRIGLFLQIPFVAAATMVWFEIEFVLSSLLLWGLANQLMTLRQGKRLFGYIVAGEPVAVIVCGLGTSLLMKFLTTPDLFLLSAIGAVVGFVLVLYITANYHPPEGASSHGEEEDHAADTAKGGKAWWKEPYIAVMIAMIVASQMIYFFTDETFYIAVEHRYGNEEAIASFLGLYSAIMGSISLAVSLFVAGPLVRRFGVRGGLITLPALLLVGAVTAVVTGQMFGVASALFFVLVTNKVIDQSFRYTLDKTTTITLYQPLPADKRMKLQAALESMVEPVTGGVAGLLLSFMLHVLGFSAIGVSAVMAVILVAWLALVLIESKGYAEVLRRAVAGRAFDLDPNAELSPDALAAIRLGLGSRHVGEVLYALQVLGDRADGLAIADVAPLLDHGEPAVRLRAAEWFESEHDRAGASIVEARLAHETVPAVRGALIAALASSAEDAVEQVAPFLGAATESEQVGAYQGLIRHGGIEGVIAAGNRLIADIDAADPDRRRLAAEVMQRVGSRLFYRPLLRLLDDPNEDVRASALAAAATIDAPPLWPAILANLSSTRLVQPALAAIGAIGDDMLDPLATLYADPASARATRRSAIVAAGVIGTPAAATWLMTLLDESDRALRYAALAALWRIGHNVGAAEQGRIKTLLRSEIDNAAWMLAAWRDIRGGSDGEALVKRALADEVENSAEAVFQLLGLMIAKVDMREARLRYVSGGAIQRSYVLEALDNVLDNDVKQVVLPFLEPEGIEALAAAQARRAAEAAGLEAVAATDEARIGAWAPASALYALALAGSDAADALAAQTMQLGDPVLRETAQWIANGRPEAGEGRDMLLTIEKILILRSVGIFSDVRESALTHAAQAIREVAFAAGEQVFAQGDFGDALYVIVSGKLKVHIGEKVLVELGERQVVGEMAALDPEPRSASVTAVEDSVLLRMSSDALERLIGDDVRVARGIIHQLCERLRKANTAPPPSAPAPATEPKAA